jgi:hypothetical protein
VVLEHAVVGVEHRQDVEPACGPCTIATATARLSVTMGFGASRSSNS